MSTPILNLREIPGNVANPVNIANDLLRSLELDFNQFGTLFFNFIIPLDPVVFLKMNESGTDPLSDSGSLGISWTRSGGVEVSSLGAVPAQLYDGVDGTSSQTNSDPDVAGTIANILESAAIDYTISFTASLESDDVTNGNLIFGERFIRSAGQVFGFMITLTQTSIKAWIGRGLAASDEYYYAESVFPSIPLGSPEIYTFKTNTNGGLVTAEFFIGNQKITPTLYLKPIGGGETGGQASIGQPDFNNPSAPVTFSHARAITNNAEFPTNDGYSNVKIGSFLIFDEELSDQTVLDLHDAFLTTNTFVQITDFTHPDLEAAWTMDNITASTLNDQTTNGIDGTIANAVATSGIIANALEFNGTDADVIFGDVLDNLLAGPDNKFSFSFWVNPDILPPSSFRDIISKFGGAAGQTGEFQLIIRFIDDTIEVRTYYDAVGTAFRSFVTSAPIVAIGVWSHLAITYDGSIDTGDGLDRIKIYKDGVEQAVVINDGAGTGGAPGDMFDSTSRFAIGSRAGGVGSTSERFFDGKVDEFRVFDRPLTEYEVVNLAAEGVKSFVHANLSAAWTMDNISAGTLFDETTNSIDGTINGASEVSGYIGNSLSFDGVDDYVEMGDDLDSVIAGADKKFSFSFWVNIDQYSAVSSEADVISKFSGADQTSISRSWIVRFDSTGKPQFLFWFHETNNETRWVQTVTSVVSLSTWTHISITYDGAIDTNDGLDRVSIYIDGVQVSVELEGSSSGALGDIIDSPSALSLGARVGTGGTVNRFFEGQLDQIRIFDKVLTPQEITLLSEETA